MTEAESLAPPPEATGTRSNSTKGDVTLTLSDIETGLAALPRARVARTVTWTGAIAVVGLVAYRWVEGRDRTSLVVIAVVLLGLLLTNRNPAKRIAKRVYAALPDDAKKLRVTVNEEGFRLTSSGSESPLPWTDVRRCVDAGHVLVVFVSQHDAQIIPKRAFDESELRSIREWSKTKVVKRAEPWLTPELRKRMLIWLVVFALVWMVWTMFGHR